jgi:plastocyanin
MRRDVIRAGRRLGTAAVGALAVAMALVGGAQEAVTAQGASSVTIVDNAYNPAQITVPQGTQITWTNTGAAIHTVTSQSGAFDSGFLTSGQTFSFTFTSPGTFDYICQVHPNAMSGTVTVTAAAQAAPQATAASAATGAATAAAVSQPATEALPQTGTGMDADTSIWIPAVVGGSALLIVLGVVGLALRRRRA